MMIILAEIDTQIDLLETKCLRPKCVKLSPRAWKMYKAALGYPEDKSGWVTYTHNGLPIIVTEPSTLFSIEVVALEEGINT